MAGGLMTVGPRSPISSLRQRREEMDIIWQRADNITYLGPNATVLKNATRI